MTLRNRTGIALLAALVAILLISALVAATMFRLTEESYLARLNTLKLQAVSAAERDVWTTLDDPTIATLHSAPLGTVKMSSFSSADRQSTVAVTKVDSSMLWIVAATTVQRGRTQARHRIALSATLGATPTPPFARPLPGAAWVELY